MIFINKNKFLIFFIFIIILTNISCNYDNTILINLNNKDKVAHIVAKLVIEKDNKEAVHNILDSYGIDNDNKRSEFIKIVQKYSYQKEFNELLQQHLHQLQQLNY